MAHIGNVIENSLGWDQDVWSISGQELMAFGDRVREWAHAEVTEHSRLDAAYYGGWPSANLTSVGWDGGLIPTSLLFEDQVVGKDPISDWFSTERYTRDNYMGTRVGWLRDTQTAAVAETRCFLAWQLPMIKRLLPLLDCDLVRLEPSEIPLQERSSDAEQVASLVEEAALSDPLAVAALFSPEDLTFDDDIRGMQVFAGGDIRQQTAKTLARAAAYFAREYTFSQLTGATYTAVFPWEDHLLREGLSQILSPYLRTTEVMLSSKLPILSGLSPEVIRKAHDDDSFGEFREQLHRVYGGCPVGAPASEVNAYVRDQERFVLDPILHQAQKDVERGSLSKLGISLSEHAFTLLGSLAIPAATGALGATADAAAIALPLIGLWADAARKQPTQGPVRIWSSLIKHRRTVEDVIPRANTRSATTADQGEQHEAPATIDSIPDNPWGMDLEPSPNVRVSAGTRLFWDYPPAPSTMVTSSEYSEGVYRPCPCGSTLKHKFCCHGLPELRCV